MIVNNMDVAGLIRRMRRFRYETVKAVSNSAASTSASDVARAKSYLTAITEYADWVVSQPTLDLPESSPREYDLGDAEDLGMPENEALVDLATMWELMEIELGNSQSARIATGLVTHDERRVREVVAKATAFLDTYVASVQPIDLPESTPMRSQTGPGRPGV